MLCASASTSRAGYWPEVSTVGAGVAGGAAGAADRVGSAGAGAVRISVGCRRSAPRGWGGDRLTFQGGAETRAFGAVAALSAGGSIRLSAAFVRTALSSGRCPSPCGPGLARLATGIRAVALAGLELPRTLGWLGVLAITSVSCGVWREA